MPEPSSTEFLETSIPKLPPEAYSPFERESVKYSFLSPQRTTYSTVTFLSNNQQEGDELEQGKRAIYVIPEKYQGRTIRDIILVHRKDPSRFHGEKHAFDPQGAYSRVLVKTENGQWLGWVDPKGYKSDKFAEPRSAYDPENEVLHDWIATVGKVKPLVVSVENVGIGHEAVSNIHKLELVFYPEDGKVPTVERIFSPGTSFIDPDKGKLIPTYGTQHSTGTYPGAIPLGRHFPDKNAAIPINSSESIDSQGKLHIKLEPGKRFLNLELAVGDTHPDGVSKNGHIGTRGWAKIYAGIKLATGKEELFMTNVNVPPEGVLSGGPTTVETGKKQDEIVIYSQNDTTYLMGYRITYEN